MNLKTLIRFAVPALMVAGSLSATSAHAYEWSKSNYDAMNKQLPPWDHDGTIPEGDSREWELERLSREAAYRDIVLDSYVYTLPAVIEASKSADGARQARKDVESQKETYDRWQESLQRRRQAIIDADGGNPETASAEAAVPVTIYPDWASADAAREASNPTRIRYNH